MPHVLFAIRQENNLDQAVAGHARRQMRKLKDLFQFSED
jgi:hypothetical protein